MGKGKREVNKNGLPKRKIKKPKTFCDNGINEYLTFNTILKKNNTLKQVGSLRKKIKNYGFNVDKKIWNPTNYMMKRKIFLKERPKFHYGKNTGQILVYFYLRDLRIYIKRLRKLKKNSKNRLVTDEDISFLFRKNVFIDEHKNEMDLVDTFVNNTGKIMIFKNK